MAINPSLGDKVNAGTSSAGAITLAHAQSIFLSDATITTTKAFTITSPLIDVWTMPVVTCNSGGISTDTAGSYTVAITKITPTVDTLNSQGEAAVITPGTLTFTVTAAVAGTAACQVNVNLL